MESKQQLSTSVHEARQTIPKAFDLAQELIDDGESLVLQKLVLGIPAQSSSKGLTRQFILLRKPRFVLFICPDPTRGSEHHSN